MRNTDSTVFSKLFALSLSAVAKPYNIFLVPKLMLGVNRKRKYSCKRVSDTKPMAKPLMGCVYTVLTLYRDTPITVSGNNELGVGMMRKSHVLPAMVNPK